MSIEALKQRLKEKTYGGVYLFFGQEEYTKDHYASRFRKLVDDGAAPEFNHVSINCPEVTPSDIYETIDQFPMMSDLKLVELKDFNLKMADGDLETYTEIFRDVPEYCIVLILVRGDEDIEKMLTAKDKKKAPLSSLLDAINNNGAVVQFERAKPNELAAWIMKHFQSKKVDVTPDAVRFMIDLCGSDMYVLHGEIEKLSAYYKGEPLTPKDVELICCKNETFVTFDLTRSLLERNLKNAERILEGLITDKVKPEFIMGTMTKFFSDVVAVGAGTEKGMGSTVLSQKLKIAEWSVRKYVALSDRVGRDFLAYCVKECYETDYKLKTSSENKYLIIKMLLSRIIAYGK